MTFAFMLTFILPVTAIVLIGESFSTGNQNRRIFSSLAIVWSFFLLLLYAVCVVGFCLNFHTESLVLDSRGFQV
jgi:hypothetical protein